MNLEYIIDFIAYLIIYSFLGWVLESVYKTVHFKKPVNSGFLIGPLCPIYGFGAAIIYLLLNNFRYNILILFVAGVIILSIWEYLAGLILERLFNTQYWDYSDEKFNFRGKICLKNSILWGVLGVVFIEVLHPITIEIVSEIPIRLLINIEVFLIILIVIDAVITVARLVNININLYKFIEITDTIKIKMDELKTLKGKVNAKSRESINLLIDELKQKQESLKDTVLRKTSRLRLAFPSMKIKKLGTLINKKFDIIDILKNDKK